MREKDEGERRGRGKNTTGMGNVAVPKIVSAYLQINALSLLA